MLCSQRFKDLCLIDAALLADLKTLTVLTLVNTRLFDEDLTPISALPHLSKLDLGQNGISDISPLADLPNLVYLDLSIYSELDLYGNTRLDLSPLTVLTDLEVLDLRPIPLMADALKHVSTMEGLHRQTEVQSR